ncbi:MAG: peptide chain release factor 2 [Flavobacteriales bacterium]|nr:peptide chain release factor 2 [Flavobacteriales bacterium]
MISEQQISALNKRKEDLFKFLNIQQKQVQLQEKEKLTHNSNFWNNSDKAQQILKQISKLKFWINTYQKLEKDLDELSILLEFFKEGEAVELEIQQQEKKAILAIEDLEFKNMLSADEDEMPAILTINPGAGGTESQDWAEMIMRMYLMWGEKNGYKIKELDFHKADPAGIKSVTLEFEGEFAFGHLKGENGVHRLVRISPFDSNAKRHTSFASVFVYPLADDSIDIIIDPSEISWDTFRSSGAGGQGVNKIESAVRLKHQPTGIIIENSETRSQLENKDKALKLLKSQLYELELRKKQEEKDKLEGNKKKIEWGSQIRNYVLHPYKLVKDLRTNFESSNPDAILDGDLNDFIKAYLMEFGQKR